MKTELTQEIVRKFFEYHEDGYLIWALSPKKNIPSGSIAGDGNSKNKYRLRVGILGESYLLHRVIFLWHHGYMPALIDHDDMNHFNNRINNLREANHSQNNANIPKQKNRSSQYMGVLFDKNSGYWCAQSSKDGKQVKKRFKSEIKAALHYNKMAVKNHGEFAALNIIEHEK